MEIHFSGFIARFFFFFFYLKKRFEIFFKMKHGEHDLVVSELKAEISRRDLGTSEQDFAV